jgi:lysophospholipase L1-like esterase
MLAVASAAIALSILAAIEATLRWRGIGEPHPSRASRLKYQHVFQPTFTPSQLADGTDVLVPSDARLPFQWIRSDKPERALRVAAFGGSAMAGLGHSPNASFSRYLEQMLRKADPSRTIEVLNLGIVALSSAQVRLLVEDVSARYQPDVVLVYSGNNEFLEVHAEKYFAKHASWLDRTAGELRRSNLYRVFERMLRRSARDPSIARTSELTAENLRLTQREIVRGVELTPQELAAVIERYAENIDMIAAAAQAAGAYTVLMTVASNWEWRGREDLPADWLEEFAQDADPNPDAEPVAACKRARMLLDRQLDDALPRERSELLFRRAVCARRLGDFTSARSDYRSAMNEDPHLRRALDAANARVREVAAVRGTALIDTIEVLAVRSEHGIIGFDVFYDYVHFTPPGAMWVAAAIFDELTRGGVVEPNTFDANDWVQEAIERLERRKLDALGVEDWIGFNFDRVALTDRDLWKYQRGLDDLDRRIEQSPGDARMRIYRGNAHSFQLDGAGEAAAMYRSALELWPEALEARANLDRLAREGRL